jgi:hypothetical protein
MSALGEADLLLRAEGRYAVDARELPLLRIGVLVALCGASYGAVMGSYGLRGEQALYAALKVPLLLGLAFLVCLPNFFVMNALLGLGADFRAACRGLLCAQGTAALSLIAFVPLTGFGYACSPSYPFALLMNAALFGLASLSAQLTLRRHYEPLIARDPRHRIALAAWLLLYVFVAIKVASILRPFVGDPREPTEFFRQRAFQENPYSTLFWAVVGLFG